MDEYYTGKVAVITGAAGTICSRVARDLAALGTTVVLVGRTPEKLQKLEAEITAAGGNAAARAGEHFCLLGRPGCAPPGGDAPAFRNSR